MKHGAVWKFIPSHLLTLLANVCSDQNQDSLHTICA